MHVVNSCFNHGCETWTVHVSHWNLAYDNTLRQSGAKSDSALRRMIDSIAHSDRDKNLWIDNATHSDRDHHVQKLKRHSEAHVVHEAVATSPHNHKIRRG